MSYGRNSFTASPPPVQLRASSIEQQIHFPLNVGNAIPFAASWLVFACCCSSGMAWMRAARADQNVVVILDDSGSMEQAMRTASGQVQRIEAAKQALISILSNLPDDTQVGVLALNTRVGNSNWIVPFGPADRSVWEPNIRRIQAAGGTLLGEYLQIGANALLQARGEQIYGTYRLLVVTDGEANDPDVLNAYLPDILSRGMIVDVIGVDMPGDHSLATVVHNYRRADDEAALQAAISEVFAESADTDDEAAAEDFELIAGLPAGMAEAALQAVVNRGNEPVEAQSDSGVSSSTSPFGSVSGGSTTGGIVSSIFGGLFCCFGGLLAVFVLAAVLLRVRSPPRR